VQPWSREFTGRIDELEIESKVLRGNALGDPNVRPLWVYSHRDTTMTPSAGSPAST
jgi:hypothetical protein